MERAKELTELERLRIERDYLLERAMGAGKTRFGLERDTGVSSNALVRFSLTGREPTSSEFPYDLDDLRACYNAQRNAPEHLRAVMTPVLDTFRQAVGERYPQVLEGDEWMRPAEARRGMPVAEFVGRIGELVGDAPEDDDA